MGSLATDLSAIIRGHSQNWKESEKKGKKIV